jgi:hypothetical protein
MDREDTEVSVEFLRETDKAILVTDTGDPSDAVWLPKSQIEVQEEDPERGDTITVTLPEWLAEDKGLI